jgi:sensor histidine kinase YesM
MKIWCQSLLFIFLTIPNIVLAEIDTLRLTNKSLSIYEKSLVLSTNNSQSIDSVRINNNWQVLKRNYKIPNNKAIWIHLYIKNPTDTLQKVFIRNPDNEISEYHIYSDNQLINKITNGEFVSTWHMNERQVVGVDSFVVKANETLEIYIKASNYQGLLPFLRVFPQKSIRTSYFLKTEKDQSLWFNKYYIHNFNELQVRTFYQGGLCVIFIIILLIYLQNRNEKLYKYYLFYVSSAVIFTLIKSRAFTYVGKLIGSVPVIKNHAGEPVMWLGFAAYLIFTAELLDLAKNHPKLYKFITNVSKAFIIYGIVNFLWLALTNDSGLQSILFIITRIPLILIYVGILIFTARKVQSSMVKFVVLSNSILIVFGLIAWLKAGMLNHQVWSGILNHLFTLPFAILLEIIVFALAIARKISEDRQAKNELEKKAIEIEMMALRSQMNPHFIFNSLNSIRYFILSNDKENAKNYLNKFSNLLRMILNHSRQNLITLQEEIDALRTYLEIESARFDDSFEYNILIDECIELDAIKIPPLILQPYVENSIIHGLRNSQKPQKQLKIKVSKNTNSIEISIFDNGIGRLESEKIKTLYANKSFGSLITNQRIELFNQSSTNKVKTEIFDLNNGTEVKIILQKSL